MYKEIWKQIDNTKYEISNYGNIRRIYQNVAKDLKTYRKGSICITKITLKNGKRKEINIGKLVAETFIRKLKANEVIYHKNGYILDNRIENLEIITKKEQGKRTGFLSRQRAIVMLDKDGVINRVFKGTREAAKELFISRQTVSDYCNKKVKKPMYRLYWADKLIERE